jgi:hypothetical protein
VPPCGQWSRMKQGRACNTRRCPNPAKYVASMQNRQWPGSREPRAFRKKRNRRPEGHAAGFLDTLRMTWTDATKVNAAVINAPSGHFNQPSHVPSTITAMHMTEISATSLSFMGLISYHDKPATARNMCTGKAKNTRDEGNKIVPSVNGRPFFSLAKTRPMGHINPERHWYGP